jgi:hypothetical protein
MAFLGCGFEIKVNIIDFISIEEQRQDDKLSA